MTLAASSAPRTATGHFAPGQSGNPAGRPKGARNKATLAAEARLEESGPDLMRKLIDASLGGDVASARFLVGRLCPADADQSITLDVAPGKERDLLAVHAAAVRAMCDDEITPKEALIVARVLAVGAKLIRLQRALKKEGRAALAPFPARGEGQRREHCDACREKPKRPYPNPPPASGGGRAAASIPPVFRQSPGDFEAPRRQPVPACSQGRGRASNGPVFCDPGGAAASIRPVFFNVLGRWQPIPGAAARGVSR
jgi:hypothetical protein